MPEPENVLSKYSSSPRGILVRTAAVAALQAPDPFVPWRPQSWELYRHALSSLFLPGPRGLESVFG